MPLVVLLACAPAEKGAADAPTDTDTVAATDPAYVFSGRVTGAALGTDDLVIAAIDASNYRFGDAPDFSTVTAWDAGTGAFTLTLDSSVPVEDVYAKAFVAAFVDGDGDGRYDARAEPLCDTWAAGAETIYLTYMEANGWAVGARREHVGEVGTYFSPTLDGDACSTR